MCAYASSGMLTGSLMPSLQEDLVSWAGEERSLVSPSPQHQDVSRGIFLLYRKPGLFKWIVAGVQPPVLILLRM